MTRSECVRELLNEYRARRMQNERELDARIEEAARLDPEIGRLREENRNLVFDTIKKVMTITDESERRARAEQMKQRGVFNNHEIRRRLKALGLPEDHLELQYRCAVCRDTGYVGEAPSRFCDCFEAGISRMLHDDSSMAGTDEQCFERFDANVFPEEDGQRARMIRARKLCEEYADSFPEGKNLNLILAGSIGQGKTFLLNCIYERVIRRGFPAIRVSAFRLFNAMRRQHLSDSVEEREFLELVEAPLLLIDDLGSEPMMRNITVEYLFMLLNERMANKRHTVIATNLSPTQLKERYDERVASRILDKTRGVALMLTGKDVRLL